MNDRYKAPVLLTMIDGYSHARAIKDSSGLHTCIEIRSTYQEEGGTLAPTQADILAKVIARYVESERFAIDYEAIAREHWK